VHQQIVPILSDKPLCVVLKLEWNPLQPSTPPPTSAKFFGSLWKNDWRTSKQPLQIDNVVNKSVTATDKDSCTKVLSKFNHNI